MFEEEADIFQKRRRKGTGVATLSMTKEKKERGRKYLFA